MVRRILLILGCALIVALARPAYLVGVDLGFWQPLTRPAGVSARARYVAAFYFGAWFDCSIDSARDVDVCRAWDSKGKLIAFGDYRLDGENRAATALELRPSDVQPYPQHPNLAWIYLYGDHWNTRGRTLVPVNKDGQPLENFKVTIGGESR